MKHWKQLEDLKELTHYGYTYWHTDDLFDILGFAPKSSKRLLEEVVPILNEMGEHVEDHIVPGYKTDFEISPLVCYLLTRRCPIKKDDVESIKLYFVHHLNRQLDEIMAVNYTQNKKAS
jgi:hypothetical protein